MDKFNYSAFPFEGGENNGMQPDPGMTLRDYFAVRALAAMIGNTDKDHTSRGTNGVKKFAKYAYEYADAMIEARGSV